VWGWGLCNVSDVPLWWGCSRYLIGFILFTTFSDFPGSPFGGLHVERRYNVELVNPNAFSLVGVLTLSYFIHNGSLSILRNAQNPKNNARDLTIAYCLGCGTYLTVGTCLYLSFQSKKVDIQQNFLDNFNVTAESYIYAFIAQCFLLLQFITVLPLLAYIVRFQTLTMICNGDAWPR
jgi:sodium-coupled neutral amino acid transporter 9